MAIKSISYEQDEILKSIIDLHLDDDCFDADITYGNGAFYKTIKEPKLKFDLQSLKADVIESCSTSLPLQNNSLNSIVFDPPFLTYIKDKRESNSIMGKRFSGYWSYDDLKNHYTKTIKECSRVLIKNGIFVVKCQDIIHNHKIHPTHINVFNWAKEYSFDLKDLFILNAKHRLPSPNKLGKQKHSRIFHSYFMVFKKTVA